MTKDITIGDLLDQHFARIMRSRGGGVCRVDYECGHAVTLPYYAELKPKVGDRAYWFFHSQDTKVVKVQDVD